MINNSCNIINNIYNIKLCKKLFINKIVIYIIILEIYQKN